MRFSNRPVVSGLGLVLATLALSACSGATAEDSPTATDAATGATQDIRYTTPRTMPEGKGSGEADGVFPRTVVHFQGETTLDAEPQKIVVISTGQADALLTLGVVPTGSTSGDGAEMIPAYLYDAFPDLADELDAVVDVGSRFAPDVETIANIAPDLIVMNNAGKDAEALYSTLAAVAPTVATQGTGLYWKQDFLLLADALGRAEQAQVWLDEYHADTIAFGERVEGDPTVSFLRKNGDRTRVFGIASFTGSVAEDAGLARPESQSFSDDTSVDISAEQIDQADADWLFYAVQGGQLSELTDLPLWPTLRAVGDEHAVAVDDDVFYLNVGPTAARGVLDVLEDTLAS
ncbi:iron-siderophore ABC transporter substrate-binding protein [Cellulomonas sp. RIT-PI-Y]|uniref:ABC transporter substrate-binding protein n=1 Tax=Cellulomonas sp. RIT-PI-Y TaxID=3035297 RepID=UPI0021D9E7E3|nr:iron-siderophore ABC transporter substrate-binding protein [Cellulomonas sp. RIT-PI-Y]